MSGGYRDDPPPTVKPCPSCTSTDSVQATDAYELNRTGKPWYCATDRLYFDGTATEAARYASKRIADAATNGTIR